MSPNDKEIFKIKKKEKKQKQCMHEAKKSVERKELWGVFCMVAVNDRISAEI